MNKKKLILICTSGVIITVVIGLGAHQHIKDKEERARIAAEAEKTEFEKAQEEGKELFGEGETGFSDEYIEDAVADATNPDKSEVEAKQEEEKKAEEAAHSNPVATGQNTNQGSNNNSTSTPSETKNNGGNSGGSSQPSQPSTPVVTPSQPSTPAPTPTPAPVDTAPKYTGFNYDWSQGRNAGYVGGSNSYTSMYPKLPNSSTVSFPDLNKIAIALSTGAKADVIKNSLVGKEYNGQYIITGFSTAQYSHSGFAANGDLMDYSDCLASINGAQSGPGGLFAGGVADYQMASDQGGIRFVKFIITFRNK